MKERRIIRTASALAVIVTLLAASGCILDPKEAVEDNPGPEVTWPDRTQRNDIIEVITKVYKYRNIEKYKELLLENDEESDMFPEGYIWRNQETDYKDYGEIYTYDQDVRGTEGILEHVISMTFIIYPATPGNDWSSYTTFRNEPCDDCWETIREYSFDIEFDDEQHFMGNYKVQFIIGPDRDGSGKYVIYQATDLPKN